MPTIQKKLFVDCDRHCLTQGPSEVLGVSLVPRYDVKGVI